MAHHHHEDDTYFLDQICMVALAGAFGVICLCMYFIQQGMMFRLLAPQFHPFVLASGVTLLFIALVRAAMLWSMAGAKGQISEPFEAPAEAGHAHAHSHGDCGHDHGHAPSPGDCGHDHAHSHAEPAHGHSHSHSHSHGHSHSHASDHEQGQAVLAESRAFGHIPSAPAPSHGHSHSHGDGDHEHGWAPWRYIVLLVPIIFFMLGIPNREPQLGASGFTIETHDPKEESIYGVTLTGLSGEFLGAFGPLLARQASDAIASKFDYYNVKEIESWGTNAADREYFKGKAIQVRGQYIPRNDRFFEVGRFKIQCCAGDAIPIRIPVVAKEPVSGFKAQDWVEIVGRVEFREAAGEHKTVIIVGKASQIKKCNPDLNPYVQ